MEREVCGMDLDFINTSKALKCFVLMNYPAQAKKLGYEDDVVRITEVKCVENQIVLVKETLRWKQ